MILDALIGKLKVHLPESTWHFVAGDVPMIVFPAVSADFGNIEVMEQDDELTVNFGRFTHSHFGCYDTALTEAECADAIASDTVSCLADVFSDRLEFYGGHSGVGGFRRRGTQGMLSKIIVGHSAHVWSGQDG